MNPTLVVYRHYLEACNDCPGEWHEPAADAWSALPWWLHIRIARRESLWAGVITAVWEVCPPLEGASFRLVEWLNRGRR